MFLPKKIIVSSLMMATLVGFSSLAVDNESVSATSYDNGTQENIEELTPTAHHLFTEAEINSFSELITVKNGEYQVDQNRANQVSLREVQLANQFVSQVNETKRDLRLYGVDLAHPHHNYFTYKDFSWGTRYYFSTNAAVTRMQKVLRNGNAVMGGASIVGGAIGGVISALAGSVVANHFSNMAADLGDYNNAHRNKQIYMDVNWTGGYSFHIWH